MYLSEVVLVRYRGFVGRTAARFEEAPVFEIDPAEFRNCLGEDFAGVDLAGLPQELRLESPLEPHGHEWIELGTASSRISFEIRRAPGRQQEKETPGYDSVLYLLFLAVYRCIGSDFLIYQELGDYPLVPAAMSYGVTSKYPQIAEWLDQMGRHRDHLEAPMMALLHWTAEDPVRAATLDFPDNWMPVFAMQLLAYWRVPAAHRPLVDLLRSPQDVLDCILGDVLTDGYDRLLSATASAPFSELRAIAEDPENEEFARATALRAIGSLTMDGFWTQSEFITWMRQLGAKLLLERPPSFVHSAFVSEVADSNIEALRADAKALFDEDLVDPLVINRKDFDLCAGLGGLRERGSATLSKPSDGLHEFLDNAFAPDEWERPATVRNAPKVGRNDPCPCGSGLKYKKCCGKA